MLAILFHSPAWIIYGLTYLYLSCLCLECRGESRREGAAVASRPQAADGLIQGGVYAIWCVYFGTTPSPETWRKLYINLDPSDEHGSLVIALFTCYCKLLLVHCQMKK